MKEATRIVFLGTPDFAVESLDILVRNGFHIAGVVTSPDQPAGRGQLLQCSPVKQYAIEHHIPVMQPLKLKHPDFLAELQSMQAHLFIVVAFRMLPEVVWSMPPLGTFNLHASLLPHYRGAAPIQHAIINGETETGLTTFFLQHEIDTGEIIFQEKLTIGPEETAGELHDRMKMAGAGLVLKTVEAIIAGTVVTTSQEKLLPPGTELKSAPKIFRENCRIDWNQGSSAIYNLIRGLSPYPAAFTDLVSPEGIILPIKIFRAKIADMPFGSIPGQVNTDGKTRLTLSASDGALEILELQQPGKRRMNQVDFLRGFRLNSDWKVG